MSKIFLSLFLFFSISIPVFAQSLSANKVVKTCTAGSNGVSPITCDSDITNISGVSISVGVPVSVPNGITAPLTGNLTGNVNGNVTGNLTGSASLLNGQPSAYYQTANSYLSNINQNLSTGSSPTFGTVNAALAGNATTSSTVSTINGLIAAKDSSITLTGMGTSGSPYYISSSGGGGGSPAGVSGQIQYNNGGVFAGGNMYIGSGGNVGIGSTNPGATLDVTGTVRATQFVATGTPPGANGYFQYANNGSLSSSNVLYNDGTNVFSNTLQGLVEINGTTATLSVPGSIVSTGPYGYIGFPQVPTPPTPVAGQDNFFFQAGDVLSYVTSTGAIMNIGVNTGGTNWSAISNYTSGKVLAATTGGNVNWSNLQNLTPTGTGAIANWSNMGMLIGNETSQTHSSLEEIIANATSFTPSGLYGVSYQNNSQSTGTLTMNNPTNVGVENQSLIIMITSTNVQTFSWGSMYDGGTNGLPLATTGSGKTDYFPFIYNTHISKWVATSTGTGGY